MATTKNVWSGLSSHRRHSKQAAEAQQAAAEEEYVRLNLEVPKPLRAALQKRAIDEGLTMKALGTKILRAYLNE